MHALLPTILALLGILAVVSLVAPRVHAPTPVLLATGGAVLTLIPGLPRLPLDPEIILVLFLPPILYADAFHTSWDDFRRWLRPILLLAIGLVGATILVVGVTAHHFLPGLPWAACFLLGAIVSPTDTVAVQTVIERLRVPRRITAIVGGESLVNDATGLVGVQLCIAVLFTGTFELRAVTLDFLWVAGGGVGIGIVTGVLFSAANRFVREPRILFLLSVIAPYAAFLVSQHLKVSGVLAVVVAGFLVSWRIHRVPPEARVDLYTAWDLIVFVLNGLCFVFIGLETPFLMDQIRLVERSTLLQAGLAVSAAVIVTRIAWCFPSAYLPNLLRPSNKDRPSSSPPWRNVALVSWCGVRGAVSLAAALSIPLYGADGKQFPGREAILACTLIVILITLVVQGLTLQPLIRILGLRSDEDSGLELRAAREAMLSAGIERLDAYCSETSCPLSVHHYRNLMADELTTLKDADAEERQRANLRVEVSRDVRSEVLLAQATTLLALRDQGTINDKTYLQLQLELDRSNLGTRVKPSAFAQE